MQKSYKILNEGEVGYGILVEKDAGETLEINKNTNFLKENEGSGDSVVRILIDCILQKAGVKNRNGRIYPKEVLVREVEKYKALIEANNSFGECVDGETEILTTNGWKFIKDIADDEQIYTLNVETNQLTVETIKNKLVKDYNGVMYHIYNNNSIDMMLTPNHNMLIYDRYGKPYTLYTEEFVERYKNNTNDITHSTFKKGGAIWIGNNIDHFVFDNIKIDIELFVAFLGIWLAEGSFTKKGYGVNVTQVKEEQTDQIKDLFNLLPFEYTIYEYKNKKVFTINNKELHKYLKNIGICYNKYIPEDIKNLPPNLLSILMDWMLLGDGSNRKIKTNDNFYIKKELYTTSKKLAEDFSELIIKLGGVPSIKIRIQKDRYIGDRLVKAENSVPLYVISYNLSNNSYIDKRFLNINKINYNNKVYCVTTENGTWLMRRNGKIAWTKNCDHPDSPTISLKKDVLSHLVRSVRWDGDTLYGTIEIITSKGYHQNGGIYCVGDHIANLLERGYKLGISSRGLGSLKKIGKDNYVQNDFELLGWDLVSSPSTPDAYLFQQSKTITESVNSENILNENEKKFKNFLDFSKKLL